MKLLGVGTHEHFGCLGRLHDLKAATGNTRDDEPFDERDLLAKRLKHLPVLNRVT